MQSRPRRKDAIQLITSGGRCQAEQNRRAKEPRGGQWQCPESAPSVGVNHHRGKDCQQAQQRQRRPSPRSRKANQETPSREPSPAKAAPRKKSKRQNLAAHPRSAQPEEKSPRPKRAAKVKYGGGESRVQRQKCERRQRSGAKAHASPPEKRAAIAREKNSRRHLRKEQHDDQRPMGMLKPQRMRVGRFRVFRDSLLRKILRS